MTEASLRDAMRRYIDSGQPAEALRLYNAYLNDSSHSSLDEATVTVAEQALSALSPLPSLPTTRTTALSAIATVICLVCLIIAARIAITRNGLRASTSVAAGTLTRAKPDVQALLRTGDALFQVCEYREALKLDTAAYSEAAGQNDDGSAATAASYMGRDYEGLGRLLKARNCYTDALDIRRRIGPSISIAYAEEIAGGLDVALGNYSDARSELTDSLARRRAENDGAGVIECLRDLADLAITQQKYSAAKDYLNVSESEAAKLNKPDMLAAIEGQQGKAALGLGDPQRAEKLLISSLSYWRSKGHSRWIASTECSLSEVKLKFERTSEAMTLGKDSLSRFRQVGDRYGEARAEFALAQVLRKTGQSREAAAVLSSALTYARTAGLKPLEKRVEAEMR